MDSITGVVAIEKDKVINATLRVLGLTQSYKGFHYLLYAVTRALDDPEILTCVCKGLYVEIALCYQTSINCAERNIRTAKEVIWHNCDPDILRSIFGNQCNSEVPCNAVFIDKLAYYIGLLLEQ